MVLDALSVENPKLNYSGTTIFPNFLLLLSSPFSLMPSSKAPKKHIDLLPPAFVLRDLHRTVQSTADDFFDFLRTCALEIPVFRKACSLSSEFQTLCNQIRFRNSRNFDNLCKHNFAAVLPGDSVAGLVVANGISSFLNIYNTLLVVRLVLTWFPNSPPAIVSPLSTICDPYLNIFRGLIPPLGGTLDLSPILAFLVLNAFTSTAAALPAELPVSETSQKDSALPSKIDNLTTTQRKWMKRLHGDRKKSSDDVL